MTVQLRGFVTFQAIGFHHWPGAPVETAYLRNLHRHLFEFKIEFVVKHADRELEYHAFQTWAQRTVNDLMTTLPSSFSCEDFAQAVLVACRAAYGDRGWVVTVDEDGENGAIACEL